MKKLVLATVAITTFFFTQAQDNDCFTRLEKAFAKRGSNTVADDMHRNVILSFFEDGGSYCLNGKVRVENGMITSIFIQYREGDFELYDKKFSNAQKNPPRVTNGISELITTADGEKLRVVFIEKLKPKAREYQTTKLPDDL